MSKSRLVRRNVPAVATVERILDGSERAPPSGEKTPKTEPASFMDGNGADTYNARAIRDSIRVFVATGALLKLWTIVSTRFNLKQKGPIFPAKDSKKLFYNSPTAKFSLSLSTILLLYRLLFRFLTRLRGILLQPSTIHFRQRNPRVTEALTSTYAPAIGASLAGLALSIYPHKGLRKMLAITLMFRALEYGWNALEDGGKIWGWKIVRGMAIKRERPWWFGSWMLQPLAFGQLLHAVVFDRDCSNMAFSDNIFRFSETYLKPPSALVGPPTEIKWLRPYEIVDALATMAKGNWPPNDPAALVAGVPETMSSTLRGVVPLVAPAHPALKHLSCATLHPGDPSCLRTNLLHWVREFPHVARYMFMVLAIFQLPRYKNLYHAPMATFRKVLAATLRFTTFLTGSIGTAWASICFFQHALSRKFLPTQRFFLGGFLAGLWAWVPRREGRSIFLYSARTSLESFWKVGVKRRWWRAMQGGDVWLFVFAMLLTGVVYEKDRKAVREDYLRKGISWVRGTGWKDWAIEEDDGSDGSDGEGFEVESETQIIT